MRGAANVAGGTCNLPLKIIASLIFVNLTQNLPTKGQLWAPVTTCDSKTPQATRILGYIQTMTPIW